jgi:hypothetical protein
LAWDNNDWVKDERTVNALLMMECGRMKSGNLSLFSCFHCLFDETGWSRNNTRVQEVLDLNLDWDTSHPDWCIALVFPHFLRVNAMVVPCQCLWPFPPNSNSSCIVCPKRKCTDVLFKRILASPEITNYHLQRTTLGKLHSGSDVLSIDHSSTRSHFLWMFLAQRSQFVVCFPQS